MALQDEINSRSKEIYTDRYSASIGELISMYKEGDLEVHPDFQRFFRWELPQQSRLIESFLLNFPIPPIFVNQKENGVWDIVDGLQRISTILQFVGIYKDKDGNLLPPVKLCGTKMLPSLDGKYYDNPDDPDNSLTEAQQRFLKRTRIDIIILKKESDSMGKYEVFQRLNTGGSSLSDQEVRNCLMVMVDTDKFNILNDLSNYENFKNVIKISDKAFKERFDLELITRFICLRQEDIQTIRKASDFGEYLNDKIISIFEDLTFDWNHEIEIFKRTFDYINEQLGDRAFSKYNVERQKFEGGFYTAVFEMVAISIGRHNGERIDTPLLDKVKKLWSQIQQDDLSWKGYSASGRLVRTLSLGDRLYEN